MNLDLRFTRLLFERYRIARRFRVDGELLYLIPNSRLFAENSTLAREQAKEAQVLLKTLVYRIAIFRLPGAGPRGRLLRTLLDVSYTRYTWNNTRHYYLHLVQSFLRGTGYVEQLKLDLSALHHQPVDDALSYSIRNNGP